NAGDELCWRDGELDVRRGSRQGINLRDRHAAASLGTEKLDFGVQCRERNRPVPRRNRSAGVTGPQHRLSAIKATDRRTARSRFALVARVDAPRAVSKIGTARPLKQIAAYG